MTPIQTVLFDLDGTLIDSKELILSSFRHTLEKHRGVAPPDHEWLATMGQPLITQLRGFTADEAEVEAMLATYIEYNFEKHDEMVSPYPGVAENLARLRESGYPLGIVTSKKREGTMKGLRRCGLPAPWFDAIVTADDVQRGKPDPEPIQIALARMNDPSPPKVVYVGDSIHDMYAGSAAGTRTAAALWGPYDRDFLAPARPDYWFERVEDLWEILG